MKKKISLALLAVALVIGFLAVPALAQSGTQSGTLTASASDLKIESAIDSAIDDFSFHKACTEAVSPQAVALGVVLPADLASGVFQVEIESAVEMISAVYEEEKSPAMAAREVVRPPEIAVGSITAVVFDSSDVYTDAQSSSQMMVPSLCVFTGPAALGGQPPTVLAGEWSTI